MKTHNEIFSDERIDTLNRARTTLMEMTADLRYHDDYSSGMVAARTEVAADAIFDVLNHGNAHFEEVRISDDALIRRQLIHSDGD